MFPPLLKTNFVTDATIPVLSGPITVSSTKDIFRLRFADNYVSHGESGIIVLLF